MLYLSSSPDNGAIFINETIQTVTFLFIFYLSPGSLFLSFFFFSPVNIFYGLIIKFPFVEMASGLMFDIQSFFLSSSFHLSFPQ